MSSSASLQYSQLGRSSFQQGHVAFAGNSDLCLSLLRNGADYGEKVFTWCFPSIASPTSSRAGAAYDIRERKTGLQSEVTGVFAKNIHTLEGVGAPVHGLGIHDPTRTGMGTPPTNASHVLTVHGSPVSRATDKDPPKLVIMITPLLVSPKDCRVRSALRTGNDFWVRTTSFPDTQERVSFT